MSFIIIVYFCHFFNIFLLVLRKTLKFCATCSNFVPFAIISTLLLCNFHKYMFFVTAHTCTSDNDEVIWSNTNNHFNFFVFMLIKKCNFEYGSCDRFSSNLRITINLLYR